jgi:L-ornithine N5-oxygenase
MTKVYDIIGIGLGPANLALAVALEEEAGEIKSLFIEEKDCFQWHPGMLIEDATIQISFLKDLVTMRNPQSKFSFLNYLNKKERLNDFVNLSSFFPSRLEYNDYMSWVAEQLSQEVQYSSKVVSVEPHFNGEKVDLLKVDAIDNKSNKILTYYAKNIVLSTGGAPFLTQNIKPTERVFHSSQFMNRIQYIETTDSKNFVIVGSGQSSAEIFYYLINNYKKSKVTATMRSISYKAVNESKLVNRIFDADMVDLFYSLNDKSRQNILQKHADTNYAVADTDLIAKINEAFYYQKLYNEDRFRIIPFLELSDLVETPERIELYYKNIFNQQEVTLKADAVVLATGYKYETYNHPVLKNINPYLDKSSKVSRDYRLMTSENFLPNIYVQGVNEKTHGISDTLLSNLAFRSLELVKSISKDLSTNSSKIEELQQI